jgi:hypothetical protein
MHSEAAQAKAVADCPEVCSSATSHYLSSARGRPAHRGHVLQVKATDTGPSLASERPRRERAGKRKHSASTGEDADSADEDIVQKRRPAAPKRELQRSDRDRVVVKYNVRSRADRVSRTSASHHAGPSRPVTLVM